MNAHQRRKERRRLLREGLPVPLWMWPRQHVRLVRSLDLDHVAVTPGGLQPGYWMDIGPLEFRPIPAQERSDDMTLADLDRAIALSERNTGYHRLTTTRMRMEEPIGPDFYDGPLGLPYEPPGEG